MLAEERLALAVFEIQRLFMHSQSSCLIIKGIMSNGFLYQQ
jgi:hypothetical protein